MTKKYFLIEIINYDTVHSIYFEIPKNTVFSTRCILCFFCQWVLTVAENFLNFLPKMNNIRDRIECKYTGKPRF